jgi:enoyl-CoA hydratase
MVSLEIIDQVAHIRLNRPEKLNAMNWDFWEGLPTVVSEINQNLSVRAAVLSAEGKSFSVGLDFFDMMPKLSTNGQAPDGETQRRLHQLIRDMQWSVTSLERCRVPVIAAIQGYCLGGAIDLITACDIRFCAADAQFGIRETKMAIVADIGTLQRLPRIVSDGIARELVYTGRDFDAKYALRIGLVNEVCADKAAVIEQALAVAREIADNAPLAVQGSKHVLNHALVGDVDRELEYVATYNAAHLMSRDLGHAVESFATKQKPEFKGR